MAEERAVSAKSLAAATEKKARKAQKKAADAWETKLQVRGFHSVGCRV